MNNGRPEHQANRREDLFAEAVALCPRVELALAGDADPVVIGFRGAAVSVYLGPDPVYHFDSQGRLRRAFIAGRIIKAEQGRLVALRREATGGHVAMICDELDAEKTRTLLHVADEQLTILREGMVNGSLRVLREESADGQALETVRQWLRHLELPPSIADTPNLR